MKGKVEESLMATFNEPYLIEHWVCSENMGLFRLWQVSRLCKDVEVGTKCPMKKSNWTKCLLPPI